MEYTRKKTKMTPIEDVAIKDVRIQCKPKNSKTPCKGKALPKKSDIIVQRKGIKVKKSRS